MESPVVFSIFHEMKQEGPLYALFLNCTLKKGPAVSNTEALCNLLIERLKTHEPDIETEIVRVVDYNVKPGIGNMRVTATSGHRSSTRSSAATSLCRRCRSGWACAPR
jgi:multimeric flavodoxin WrbA